MLALPFILHTNELLQYNILRSFFFTSKEQNAFVLIQSSQWFGDISKLMHIALNRIKNILRYILRKI